MAIRRKGTRRINIDGVTYRWRVSSKGQAQSGKILVIIQCEDSPGAGIAVHVPCRDFWLDLPDITPKELAIEAYRPLKPLAVRTIILVALKNGWQPQADSKQSIFDYDWKLLTPRT